MSKNGRSKPETVPQALANLRAAMAAHPDSAKPKWVKFDEEVEEKGMSSQGTGMLQLPPRNPGLSSLGLRTTVHRRDVEDALGRLKTAHTIGPEFVETVRGRAAASQRKAEEAADAVAGHHAFMASEEGKEKAARTDAHTLRVQAKHLRHNQLTQNKMQQAVEKRDMASAVEAGYPNTAAGLADWREKREKEDAMLYAHHSYGKQPGPEGGRNRTKRRRRNKKRKGTKRRKSKRITRRRKGNQKKRTRKHR